jgi:hypothetical protein
MKRHAWLLVAVLVLAAGLVEAAPPDLSVLPARVRGVVLLPDGESPVSKMQVRLWNADTEEVVFRTRTDEDGVIMSRSDRCAWTCVFSRLVPV